MFFIVVVVALLLLFACLFLQDIMLSKSYCLGYSYGDMLDSSIIIVMI